MQIWTGAGEIFMAAGGGALSAELRDFWLSFHAVISALLSFEGFRRSSCAGMKGHSAILRRHRSLHRSSLGNQ
jgi:hypothetical protein